MREIKFRAWNGNSFCYFDLKDFKGFHKEFDVMNIQQFTGLKDKNKKEIYEGDIVKYRDDWDVELTKDLNNAPFKIDLIIFNECDNKICLKDDSEDIIFKNKTKEYEVEVIGNIYENPELLTQKHSKTKGGKE